MKLTSIYALIDPRNNECRYVGKTVDLKARFNRHCNLDLNNKTHSACWIRSIKPLRPKLVVLEEAKEDWVEAEMFWIAYMKSLGARLTNISHGGEGPLGIKVSAETRLKMSKSQSGRISPMKGRPQSLKWKTTVLGMNKGRKFSDEAKANMSKAQTGRVKSEETKAKISANHKIKFNTPEMFEKLSAQRKGRPAWNKGIFGPSGQKRSDETKALMSEKAKLREQKKRETGYVVSEETRRKISEAGKNRFARERASWVIEDNVPFE